MVFVPRLRSITEVLNNREAQQSPSTLLMIPNSCHDRSEIIRSLKEKLPLEQIAAVIDSSAIFHFRQKYRVGSPVSSEGPLAHSTRWEQELAGTFDRTEAKTWKIRRLLNVIPTESHQRKVGLCPTFV